MVATFTTARAVPNNAANAFARQPQFQCLSGSTIFELERRNLLQVTPNGRWHVGGAEVDLLRRLKEEQGQLK
jgi:hypothetical protein